MTQQSVDTLFDKYSKVKSFIMKYRKLIIYFIANLISLNIGIDFAFE